MKPWQKGIELDTLLEMEKIWSTYNDTVLSPFLEMKKNSIASVGGFGKDKNVDLFRHIRRGTLEDFL